MNVRKKLNEWRTEGLIDEETIARIGEYEKKLSRPILMYAVGTLGGLSIAVGLLSVVAANWDGISNGIKLSLSLALGAALAAGLFYCHETKRNWVTEILVILYYGYTLSAFALIGQVYHSGTPPYQAFLLWTAVTIPLVLIGQSYLLGVIWLAGLITSHVIVVVALLDYLNQKRDLKIATDIVGVTLLVSPFLYLLLSRIPWIVKNRSRYSVVFGELTWFVLFVAGFLSQFIWYYEISPHETLPYGVVVCAVLVATFGSFLRKLYPSISRHAHLAIGVTLGIVCLTAAFGVGVSHDDMPLIGSVSSVLFFAGTAWVCLSLGAYRWFHVATGLIAARLIAMYFEVFGSMMDTGLGLMLGGVLAILLAWFWRKKSNYVVSVFTKNREPNHV